VAARFFNILQNGTLQTNFLCPLKTCYHTFQGTFVIGSGEKLRGEVTSNGMICIPRFMKIYQLI